jgi:hypothetical protein
MGSFPILATAIGSLPILATAKGSMLFQLVHNLH